MATKEVKEVKKRKKLPLNKTEAEKKMEKNGLPTQSHHSTAKATHSGKDPQEITLGETEKR
ncbi:MAG TPA: hypothetical protein HPP79_14090 [Gammaproteobacteria bacterium]|nr:hypothetical protein [Gammaproteobacteria bacterium]HIJ28402.1 hypothetical protein [Gammaproteobacteria bacterium]